METRVNQTDFVVVPCTRVSMPTFSIPKAYPDETALWRLEGSSDSDLEIQQSVRRGQIQFPDAQIIKTSTPYLKDGIMYADFQNYWGVDDAPVLVWKASSLLRYTSLGKRELDAQRKLDPLRYAREFEAEFIDAIDAFIPARWIENAVERDRVDNPPSPEFRRVWTIDQSERRGDAFVFVTGHQEDDGTAVIDCVRSWSATDNATVNLETTVQEIVNIGSRYGENPLFIGDQSSQGWVAEAFQRAGASFIKSEINTSD